jgi:hypothetical protein
VANAFWHDEHVPFVQLDCALRKLDAQMPSQDEEQLVLVSMTVPGKLPWTFATFT